MSSFFCKSFHSWKSSVGAALAAIIAPEGAPTGVEQAREDTTGSSGNGTKTRLCSVTFLVALLLTFFILPGNLSAKQYPQNYIAKQYRQAKAYYQNLISTKRGQDRRNWLTCVKGFRKLYKAYPRHEVAPRSLFMLGKIYHDMYSRSKNPLDLGEAIAYYEDVATLYAKHRLADDALFSIGHIYLADKKEDKKAARTFARIIALYPKGDMAHSATAQLERLRGEPMAVASPAPKQTVKRLLSIEPRMVKRRPRIHGKSSASSTERATMLPIRYWSSSRYTRVVMETNTPVKFKHKTLGEDKKRPRRLYIDLLNCGVSGDAEKTVPIQDGLLKQVRNAQFTPETVRVVLDTQKNISDYKIFSLENPFRVVVDVMSSSKNGQNGPSKEALSLVRQLGLGVGKIVIDPGHGGKDPGTTSKSGLKEKDIVLKVAKKMAKRLRENLNCEVVLTRNSDVFIPLEERTAIANSKEGDLFISVHVNAAPTSKAKGIETYVLDLATNKDAMRVAALENATSARQLSDLQSILMDLMNNTKIKESLKLAELVQDNMVNGLARKYKTVKNLGVKKAPFVVLIGAQMPAILTEIAFISNPEEEKRLRSEAYLNQVADHIATGVAGYVETMSLAMNLAPSSR